MNPNCLRQVSSGIYLIFFICFFLILSMDRFDLFLCILRASSSFAFLMVLSSFGHYSASWGTMPLWKWFSWCCLVCLCLFRYRFLFKYGFLIINLSPGFCLDLDRYLFLFCVDKLESYFCLVSLTENGYFCLFYYCI